MKQLLHDLKQGEKVSTILYYFFPEFIMNFVVYAMPMWLDAIFIGSLESVSTYATLGVTSNIIHFIIKIAEALSVGTVVMSGQFNGKNDYKQVGRTACDAFWVTCLVGFFFSSLLYFGAFWIYKWYGVNEQIIHLGVPFIRLRALGVLFMFIFFALIGFLRGIKNTRSPMKMFIFGAVLFIFFDYVLVFGKWGFPKLGFNGSAMATIIQYGSMLAVALGYVVCSKKNRKYGIELFSPFKDFSYARRLIALSIPVLLDKAAIALAYVWLGKMIAPMGTSSIAAFCAIKDMERFAFLPALAFAQVVTFLVSNDCGAQNWEGIKGNIKKILLLSFGMVAVFLIAFSCYPGKVLCLLDKNGDFSDLVIKVFPLMSLLVMFDLLQLILSGALRGAGNVQLVMFVRIAVCLCYFAPLSYFIAQMTIQDEVVKFLLIYGSYYMGSALMSIAYINRFRGDYWKIASL